MLRSGAPARISARGRPDAELPRSEEVGHETSDGLRRFRDAVAHGSSCIAHAFPDVPSRIGARGAEVVHRFVPICVGNLLDCPLRNLRHLLPGLLRESCDLPADALLGRRQGSAPGALLGVDRGVAWERRDVRGLAPSEVSCPIGRSRLGSGRILALS